jgi:hypothetical protein
MKCNYYVSFGNELYNIALGENMEDLNYYVTGENELYAIANIHGVPVGDIRGNYGHEIVPHPPYTVVAEYLEFGGRYDCEIYPVYQYEEQLYDVMERYKKQVEQIVSSDEFKEKYGCDGNLPGSSDRDDTDVEFILAHGAPYVGLVIGDTHAFLEGQWDRGKYRMIINIDRMKDPDWLDEVCDELNSLL